MKRNLNKKINSQRSILERSRILVRDDRRVAFGFTLAEVLITLGIIGVISAMTLPTLIKNYQKQETVTRLKKIYSIISQAYQNAQLEQGMSGGWDSKANGQTDNDWWEQYFIPYAKLNIIKTCEPSNASECWAKSTFLDSKSCGYISGSKLVLKDGTVLALEAVTATWARIWVDINGLKPPNVVGNDVFVINIEYKLGYVGFEGQGTPRNALLTMTSCGCNKKDGNSQGLYCGALIQQDGWQIKDDYPWN